jgi:hypothetical protein
MQPVPMVSGKRELAGISLLAAPHQHREAGATRSPRADRV